MVGNKLTRTKGNKLLRNFCANSRAFGLHIVGIKKQMNESVLIKLELLKEQPYGGLIHQINKLGSPPGIIFNRMKMMVSQME